MFSDISHAFDRLLPPGMEAQPTWNWPAPDDLQEATSNEFRHRIPGAFSDDQTAESEPQRPENPPRAEEPSARAPRASRTWLPRTCRICLETVQPTYHLPSEHLPGFLQPASRVTYESEDPESGPLISPCKCRGSSRFVHTDCLQTWRYADPGFGNRNYYHCPTCGFRYRLQRLGWGQAIKSKALEIGFTIIIFLLAMFLLGFVADPIINLYLDPYDTITSGVGSRGETTSLEDSDFTSWGEHFVKGLASLGLLGFVKVFFALSPWQWWNPRNSGVLNGGARTGNNGRDRLTSINWVVIVLGVCTFLWVSLLPLT